METETTKEYYVSMKVSEELSNSIGKLKDYTRELKKNRNRIYSLKIRCAEIRKEMYERLISLRLGIDKFMSLLPQHEAKLLEKKLDSIKRYIKRERKKKEKIKEKEKKKDMRKKKKRSGKCPGCGKNFKRLDMHTCKIKEKKKKVPVEEDLRLESEKQELESLRRDLENISDEIEKHKR